MSKLRNLIEKGPTLVGAQYPDQWVFLFLAAFDADRLKKTTVFDLKDGQSIEDRLEILRGILLASGVNARKAGYWIDLVILYAYSCAVAKGRNDLEIRRKSLETMLSDMESEHPEIAAVMPVSKAATATQWA